MKDNIKMDLREMGCDPGDWVVLTKERDHIRTVVNLRNP